MRLQRNDNYNFGRVPEWAWMQLNGKSAQWNYNYQKMKIYEEYKKQEEAKRREEAKKEIEKQIVDAIMLTMDEGSELLADAVADDIVNSINAAIGGAAAASQISSQSSFAADLGAMLGRALGEAPFKLLDEIFEDDDE